MSLKNCHILGKSLKMKRNRLGDKKRNLPNTGVELSNPAVNGVLSFDSWSFYFDLKELGHSIFNYCGHVIEFLQIEGNLKDGLCNDFEKLRLTISRCTSHAILHEMSP